MSTMRPGQLYPRSDLYGYENLLSDPERDKLWQLRQFLDETAAPLIDRHWEAGTFPTELIPEVAKLDIVSPASITAGADRPRNLFGGFRTFEWARTDASLNTFFGGQASLFRTSILDGGSPEQVERWDPLVRDFSILGGFALTEPESGSDIARGLSTTAERTGDDWTLSGHKRWIGNAPIASHLIVFARDVADGAVKGFIVPTSAPGMAITNITGKTALRIVQNGDIVLDRVVVNERDRLQRITSFRDVSNILRFMRSDVAWGATGVQAGAYEAALDYVRERRQFGRSLGSFQLVQSHLSAILGNLTASLGMVVGLSQKQDAGTFNDEDSALAKSWVTTRMRESVARAREIVGGNGIVLANKVARFHADAEAIYTYEGTKEINDLVVGRAVTGESAFL
ncbi:MAG: glutaryl-CoA dehydrogenase [Microbacteriaceae bacterium]|nr:glutaryl-CoA dehydrogenase [Microbacteriaceae bacterium]